MRWEELNTPEAVLAAFEAGRRVEFTTFKESDDPLQGVPGENGCGWIKPMSFAKRPYEAFAKGYRYRALIEEPAIPAGYTPWGGEEASWDVVEAWVHGGRTAELKLQRTIWSHETESSILDLSGKKLYTHLHPVPAEPLGRDAEESVEMLAMRAGAKLDRSRGAYTLTGEQLRSVARRLRPQVDDAAIEAALDQKIGLDNTLRQLIRGDTMAIGYSKVDVVRALLTALGFTAALTEADSHG